MRKLPLLLDGDVAGAFIPRETGPDDLQQWMLQNPDKVAAVQQEFVQAGAQILRAASGGLTMLELGEGADKPDTGKLNRAVVALTQQAAGEQIPVAGVIKSTGFLPEPFGPMPFTDLIDTYAQQAIELKMSGVAMLVLEGMSSFSNIRAAVLGARQASLPMIAIVDMKTSQGGSRDPLPVLLCLQELGIEAFGVSGEDSGEVAVALRKMAPYAKVPLAAQLDAGADRPEEYAQKGFELLAAGARILLGGQGCKPNYTRAFRRMIDEFDFSAFPLPRHQTEMPLLLADPGQVYYLEEDYVVSPAISCRENLPEAILEADKAGADVLRFRVNSIAEAYLLGQEIQVADSPVCLLAENEEALELALLLYQGRALVDSGSAVDAGTMTALAAGYGAALR